MYKLLFENEDFVVVDKFPGVDFHKREKAFGLMETLRSDLGIECLFPVHRLDKMTSGILLIAKRKEIAAELSKRFQNRQVEKYYIAISDQKPGKKQGLIRGDLERTRRGAWKLSRSQTNPSITQFFSKSIGNHLRLFLLKPHTGQTHQLRVVLKSIGAPALGDPVYYKSSVSRVDVDRGYLHAFAIKFRLNKEIHQFIKLPDTGHYFNDDAFKQEMSTFSQPWELNWPNLK